MVHAEAFQPIKWENVNWTREGFLYRGCVQSDLEQAIFNSYDHQRLYYCGLHLSLTSESDMFTWTTPNNNGGAYYAKQRTGERSPSLINKYETIYPIIMRINAQPYRDNLGLSREEGEQDGIVIRGPIALPDIEVIFASHIFKPENETQERSFRSMQTRYSAKDLLDHYKERPRDVINTYLSLKFGLRIERYTEAERQAIKDFLDLD